MKTNINSTLTLKSTGNIIVKPVVTINKKIQVYKVIPEKLKLAIDKLGLSNIMRDKAIKLVCLIINAGMEKNHDLATYIPLPVEYLQKIFTPFYHTDFFNLLKSKRIIESNEKYKQDSKAYPGYSKGYRINESLLSGEFVSISYQDNKINNEIDDYINLYRTYFYTNPLSTPTKLLPDTSSISSTHPTHIIPSTYRSTTSSIMHIITKLFDKSLIYDDLSSLFYDEAKIWEDTKAKISIISTKLFKTDQDVLRNFFEVVNHINGLTYYTTRNKAIKWCRENGVTLIQDGKYFYIDDLDRYVILKKRNLLLNYKWYIAKFKKKIFYANRNITNKRLDHNLTSLNKDTMKIIKEDNDLIEIDMKNCQFAIHAYWMKQKDLCIHEDVKRYYDMCSKGTLYDDLAVELKMTRDEAKLVMMELAFSSEKYYTPYRKLFREHFPNVIAHIDGFKKEKKDSSLFSVELQELEAEIFVDNLYPNIKELGLFCLTKHDSLIVRRANEEPVLELIRSYFKYLELECVLDIEGRLVPMCSDSKAPENEHGNVLDAQIQDETEIAIEHKPEAEFIEKQEEYERNCEDPENNPGGWCSLEYYIDTYGEDGKEMYESQFSILEKLNQL